MCVLAGHLWLGNPKDPKERAAVKLLAESLSKVENIGTTPQKLAIKLLHALFTRKELSKGKVTIPRKAGVLFLDQIKIGAIRSKHTILWLRMHSNHTHTHTHTHTHIHKHFNMHIHIPAHLKYRFPVIPPPGGETEEMRWTRISQKSLNPKCRSLRDV